LAQPANGRILGEYARIRFEHFRDRVKHWITINEPCVTAVLGYGQGHFTPGRTSAAEPYRAAHEMLRAHGRAVEIYRHEFQPQHSGIIGITTNCDWPEPLTGSDRDQAAAERAREFFLGWFADPVYRGEYPASMRERVGDLLPRFTGEDAALIRGSNDFFGLNRYTTMFAAHAAHAGGDADPSANVGPMGDQEVSLSRDPSWPLTDTGWPIVPAGCRKLLEWIDARYDGPEIVLTENGCAFDDPLVDEAVHDQRRIDFHAAYLTECHRALRRGVRLKGYFVWSLLDNFEWAAGYSQRFGIHHADFATQRRVPKASARWYAEVIAQGGLRSPHTG
jgi:beta-glucosidase/6-phospho-beta-glucosidase/beta-galactosidase